MNPENLPRIAGYLCLFVGLYLTRIQVKRLLKMEPGKPGFAFRLLFYGVVFLGLGIFLVLKKI